MPLYPGHHMSSGNKKLPYRDSPMGQTPLFSPNIPGDTSRSEIDCLMQSNITLCSSEQWINLHIDGLVHERCNSSALAMELHLSCTNLSICNRYILSILRINWDVLYLFVMQFLSFHLTCEYFNKWMIIYFVCHVQVVYCMFAECDILFQGYAVSQI